MKLLKSYAHQVVSYHPSAARDELFAEIYDEICEEYADRLKDDPELSEAQFLETTKQHPMKYATQLAADGSAYLVGPRLYFSFISALKTGASITAGLFLILALIAAVESEHYWRSFLQVLMEIPEALLWVSAAILGVFVALDKTGEKATWLENWTVAELTAADDHQAISRGEAFFDLGFSTLALLWILDIIKLPAVVRHDGTWIEDWVVMLPDWFWPLAVSLLLFDMGYSLLRLTRSLWTRRLRLVSVVTNLLWLALLGFAIWQPQLLEAGIPDTAVNSGILPIIDNVLRGILAVMILIIGWDTLVHIRRLVKSREVGESFTPGT